MYEDPKEQSFSNTNCQCGFEDPLVLELETQPQDTNRSSSSPIVIDITVAHEFWRLHQRHKDPAASRAVMVTKVVAVLILVQAVTNLREAVDLSTFNHHD